MPSESGTLYSEAVSISRDWDSAMINQQQPLQRVGVIGGGQLAWMMAPAAQKLGLELRVQTPLATDPAGAIAQEMLLGDIQDGAVTRALAVRSDVITFENEFVDLGALSELAAQGVQFAPSLAALAPLLDKSVQRRFLADCAIAVPQFLALAAVPPGERSHWQNPFGFPVVLKARRLGYDGQGTMVLRSPAALQTVLDREGFEPFLLEEFIPFERELAVMAARNGAGEQAIYPVVETYQVDQVCHWVIAPAAVDRAIAERATAIAQTLLSRLDFVGILGIEFFLAPPGPGESELRLLVNEVAPRTHNSGHYSLDACVTSQFEQQLRAVTQRPLGETHLTGPGAVMVNLLGFETTASQYEAQRQQLAQIPGAHLYWYGKHESRPGRKLGHVTVLLTESEAAARQQAAKQAIAQIDRIWSKP